MAQLSHSDSSLLVLVTDGPGQAVALVVAMLLPQAVLLLFPEDFDGAGKAIVKRLCAVATDNPAVRQPIARVVRLRNRSLVRQGSSNGKLSAFFAMRMSSLKWIMPNFNT